VRFVHSIGEECPEVRTASRHDGSMNGEVTILHSNHSVTQLTVLAQIIQHIESLPKTLNIIFDSFN